jgi:N-formylglutamate amidohydrolase
LLLDVHSMPPLPGSSAARIVVGDRFGRSAGGRLVHRIEAEIAASGHRAALNTPYPGGHILSRHGRPDRQIHAIQIEIDRRLYLDTHLTVLGKGFGDTAALLRRIIDAATDELLTGGLALAAE